MSLVHSSSPLGPSVDVLGSEVSLRAPERKVLVAGLSSEDLEHSIGVGVPRDIYDLASVIGVLRSCVNLDIRHLRRTQNLGSIKKGSDMRVVKNSVASLEVVVSVVGLRLESIPVDQLRVPSNDELSQRTLGNETTKGEVLDHEGHDVQVLVESDLVLESKLSPGFSHVGSDVVVNVFDGVVVINHLGVISIVKAEVGVLTVGQGRYLSDSKRRRSLDST